MENAGEDGCNEQRRLAQQLERIIARMKCFSTDGEEPADLPPELRLEEGYEHLSETQKQHLVEVLRSEAAFFMKGKYPKVIERPVHINVGQAVPRTSGFRRLNPEEQKVVNEYVEKLLRLMTRSKPCWSISGPLHCENSEDFWA